MVACNTSVTKETEKEVVKVEIADLISNTDQYAADKIEVTAVVNHICKHGGKKMFLINQETEETIKVVPGENMAAFNSDLVGHKVSITGTIEKLVIDEAYLKEWEAELIAEAAEEKTHTHLGEGEHTHGENDSHNHNGENEQAEEGCSAEEGDPGTKEGMEDINNLRKQIAESETDRLVFYTIICEKVKAVETETAE
ncbi:MAG: hypothetical protein CL663_07480 [Bacteroidetes bacterium]|nr:hypothetical protein [Bacteroidota bacterium]